MTMSSLSQKKLSMFLLQGSTPSHGGQTCMVLSGAVSQDRPPSNQGRAVSRQVPTEEGWHAEVEMWNSGDYRLELQFSIRETVCTKASGRDPFTCDFKIGPFVPTSFCRSVVEVSGELISNIVLQCRGGRYSSESISSEEMMHMPVMSPSRQGSSPREDLFAPEALPSRRGSRHEDWHRSSYFSSAKTE
ncbi:secreted phosphoprotein 24 isoform X1 [Heliangelus exortis]|uniref:secreted phosphoprotein 24 isoform X1 n=1 Tax=Heliangelus exortis TaxID=472823 RepID=UPI003A8EFD2E